MFKPVFPDKYDWHGCDAVQFDPEKLSGCATVGATRMNADGVLENHFSGMSAAEIADCFDIDPQAVETILEFAASRGLKPVARLNMADIDWAKCSAVESVHDIMSGTWVLRGTRMPVLGVLENMAAGASIDEIVEWFDGLDRGQVEAVLEFARANQHEEVAVAR